MKQSISLLSFLLLATNCILAQFQLSGIVVDSIGAPLPFVNILINDSQKDGVSTDIDGKFTINQKQKINKLIFSYLGYKNLTRTAPFKESLKITLTSTAYSLEEITITAGENPAHRIIKNAVKNRNQNDPEKMESYSCQTYNKMVLGYSLATEKMHEYYLKKDTSKKTIKRLYRNYQKSHEIFSAHDLLVIESVSNRQFKKKA